ncbi:MAG: cadherin repeat domain-containing protein [Hyphomicrobiaceae bacterium]|nr:cadherin repeat domain-containing protein [Hyphomicrobiaceae bacterium]
MTVLWDQLNFTTITSANITAFTHADDFVLQNASTLTSLSAMLTDDVSNNNGVLDSFSGTLSWGIYSNNAGSPGTLLFSGEGTPALTDTGQQDFYNNDIVRADLTLTTAVVLDAGTYWLALHEGAWGSPSDASVVWWQQAPSFGSVVQYSDPSPTTWTPNAIVSDTSFSLTGRLTYVVTTLADVVDANDGLLSLREAIAAANADAGSDGITFAAGLSGGTIRLALGTLLISDELTIDGDINNDGAPDITITGDVNGDDTLVTGSTSISNIVASATAGTISDNVRALSSTSDLTINGLVITGGNAGGGQGGGIFSDANLDLSHSVVAGNTAFHYGGVRVGGVATIADSTISGNVAAQFGGGIGGLTELNLTNVTVSGNSAGTFYGGAGTNGDLNVLNSTITGNIAGTAVGGIVAPGGTVTLTNSIVLGNPAIGNINSSEVASTNPIVYTGLNIVGVGSDTNASDGVINASSLDAVFASVALNPFTGVLSGVLADNGGGIPTVALAPSATNPALDASNTSAPATDARGVSAFDIEGIGATGSVPGIRDLGAYELVAQPPVITDLPAPLQIDENTTGVLATLAATDADSSSLTWSLAPAGAGNSNGAFAITASGQLSLVTAQDFETSPSVNVEVVVSDGLFNTTRTFAVTIGDVNESPTQIVATGTGAGGAVELVETAANGTLVADLSTIDPDGNPDPTTPTTFELVDALGNVIGPTETPFRINGSQLVVDIDETIGTAGYPLDYAVSSSIVAHVRATNGAFSIIQDVTVAVQRTTGIDGGGNQFQVSYDTTDQFDWMTTTYYTSNGGAGRLWDVQQVNDDGSSQRTVYFDPADPYAQQTSYRNAAGELTDVQTLYGDGHGDRTLYDPSDNFDWSSYAQYLRAASPGGPLEVYDEIGNWDADYAGNPGGHWRNIYDVGDQSAEYDRIYISYDANWVMQSQTIYYDDGLVQEVRY